MNAGILIVISSLSSSVITSDIILPVLLQTSNRTSDNVRNSISNLLQYSKKMSLQHPGENSQNEAVIYFESSPSNSSRQGFSASGDSEVNVAADVSKSSSLMISVQKLYNSIEFPDLENIRFHVIMEKIIPDLSFIKNICPGDCEGCLESYAEVFCRICCEAKMKEPMSISSFLYDHFDHVLDWLTSSKAFKGLKAIYNITYLIGRSMRNADQHVFNPKEINTFIRNFHWHRSNSLEPKMPKDFETNLNRSSFDAPEICGYFEQGESRADQGRIVGGMKVKKLSMFPWQMSLSTGFIGLFYQHRYQFY